MTTSSSPPPPRSRCPPSGSRARNWAGWRPSCCWRSRSAWPATSTGRWCSGRSWRSASPARPGNPPRWRGSGPEPGRVGEDEGMDLPVMPPVGPMLAKSVKDIPHGSLSFEPKWDGFRSIIFRDGAEVEIGSRNERPMTRYFPEVVDAALANLPERCVLDGEIVIPDAAGRRLDFEALLQRVHPADSRVRLLAVQTPAAFVAFDLLALDGTDFTGRPFSERRAALEGALADAGVPVHLTRTTLDRDLAAQWFSQFEGAGLDGIVAKPLEGTYQQDKRVMFKVKHERTADCVVAGYRPHKSGPDAIGSLLLGLYDDAGRLASVGVVGAFPMAQRRALFTELQPLVTTFEGHPWNWGQAEGTAERAG